MALKKKLTTEEYNDLSDGVKEAYIENGEGYLLDLEADDPKPNEELGQLKRAQARIKAERQEALDKAQELSDKLAAIEGNNARKSGDVEKLSKQHQKEIEAERKKHQDEINRQSKIHDKWMNDKAEAIAAKLGGKKAKVLLPHIKQYVQIDLESDEPGLVFIDESGQSCSQEDLEKSILDDEAFQGILVGSKASGSGASGNNSSGGASTAKKFTDYQSSELVQLRRADPAAYDKLVSDFKAAKN